MVEINEGVMMICEGDRFSIIRIGDDSEVQ